MYKFFLKASELFEKSAVKRFDCLFFELLKVDFISFYHKPRNVSVCGFYLIKKWHYAAFLGME